MSAEKSKDDLVREWTKQEEQRPKLRKTASQTMKKSPVDQIFDKLMAREHVILEALGFFNDESEYKSFAVHQLICGQIRNAQDELKEQYPKLK